MKIKAFYRKEKENLFLQSPMSDVQCPESAFCPMSNVYCLMSDFSDFMHFRYYASAMGRFMRPDNILGNLTNPQSFNRYSYVKGNPVNFNDPTGHAADQPPQQENKQDEQPGPTQPANQNQAAMKKQEQKMVDQPKKVGDDLFKLTLDVSALAAIATDKAANPTLTQSAAKTAEDWGLVLKQPEFKMVGNIAGGAAAVFDAATAFKNVFTPRAMGSGMSKKELRATLFDIGENVVIGAISLYLEPATGLASSIPLLASTAAVFTDIGKLANAYMDISLPVKASQDASNPKSWATSGKWY